MSGEGGNQDEKLELVRISCASEFTIPYMGGSAQDLEGSNNNTMSPRLNQASRTGDCSYPVVSSISFLSSSPISLPYPQLYHHCRIQSHVIPLYLSLP